MFELSVVFPYYKPLLSGLFTTFWISIVSILIGFFVALVLCQIKTSRWLMLRSVARIYISFFRGTPLLVQLAIIFYFLPLAGIFIPPAAAAIIALSMNTGAFQAEILRGGFRTLPNGQLEACWTYGFSPWQSYWYIQLPQVVRKTLPALVNETIDIIKNSALISTIAVVDLMRIAQTYSSTTYRPLEFFFAAGVLYLTLTQTVAYLGRRAETKLANLSRS
ncbi:amino acid ABC transporter permease [Vibrio sp. WXL103]|uniref:amino acid ABC transporter permease n=1 Tax=unclassified Vibrio TaxID=2614977 RepID=UPI003EC9327E